MEFGGSYRQSRDVDTYYRLKETLDSVTSMLYQRAGLTLEIPFSESLLDTSNWPAVSEPQDQALLALEDATAADSSPVEAALDPVALAQGLEHVQQYEAQQRQDLAAEQASEVLEPVLPSAEAEVVVEAPQPSPESQTTATS